MLKINSFFHRQRFCNLLNRWFVDDFRPEDPLLIKQIVNFNAISLKHYLEKLSIKILKQRYQSPIIKIPVRQKKQLKDAIIRYPMSTTARTNYLIEKYVQNPQNYYLQTPLEGNIYYTIVKGKRRFIGANRMKRMKRIAEKASRKVIELLFSEIIKRAEAKAQQRAERLGVNLNYLVSSAAEMEKEFIESEGEVLRTIRDRSLALAPNGISINDVGGMKIIVPDREIAGFIDRLNELPYLNIREIETHSGNYNATNVVVEYFINKDEMTAKPPPETILKVLESRGMQRYDISRFWRKFYHSAEDSLWFEFIIANYEDLLESEIGRAMHETRIITQRNLQNYHGHLAKNVEYLIEYILQFAQSPSYRIDAIPFKLWGKYIPDFFEIVKRNLYGVPTHFGIGW